MFVGSPFAAVNILLLSIIYCSILLFNVAFGYHVVSSYVSVPMVSPTRRPTASLPTPSFEATGCVTKRFSVAYYFVPSKAPQSSSSQQNDGRTEPDLIILMRIRVLWQLSQRVCEFCELGSSCLLPGFFLCAVNKRKECRKRANVSSSNIHLARIIISWAWAIIELNRCGVKAELGWHPLNSFLFLWIHSSNVSILFLFRKMTVKGFSLHCRNVSETGTAN